MHYKIIYHVGNELTIKTKVSSAVLILENDSICITGESKLLIPFSKITSIEMFRLHGLGRMLKVSYTGSIIYLTVVRFNFLGYFVLINFFKTGRLYESIRNKSHNLKLA